LKKDRLPSSHRYPLLVIIAGFKFPSKNCYRNPQRLSIVKFVFSSCARAMPGGKGNFHSRVLLPIVYRAELFRAAMIATSVSSCRKKYRKSMIFMPER
jgi:hypothetical protein